MIYRYKHQARRAAELKLGELEPRNEAISELAPKPSKGDHGAPGSGQEAPARALLGAPRAASDSKFFGLCNFAGVLVLVRERARRARCQNPSI